MHILLTSIRFLLFFTILCHVPVISSAVNVKDFGAKGDGLTDNTKAIAAAVRGATDGVVEFPRGSYRLTHTIEIILTDTKTLGLTGMGGSARILMDGEGPAFSFTGSHTGSAGYSSVKPVTLENERMPLVEDLEIVGVHPKADGLRFHLTFMPVFKSVMIRDVHHGIHFTSRARNLIITGCHIYHCSGIGIYLDSVNIHQIIIANNHISYCREGGIKIRKSEIRNIQITGNDIEYNYDPDRSASADIWVDCSGGGSVREGTISGNTIQAIASPGGANIRFTGSPDNPRQIGLWAVSGNHISNQTVNVELDHVQGISLTGNSFILAYDRHMVINNSKNIVVSSNVFDHNEDYYRGQEPALGGIYLYKGQNIMLNNNIIDIAEYGSPESGGAVTVKECRVITIQSCQIINPKFRGIWIENSSDVLLADCFVDENIENPQMLAGLELRGECPGTVIRDNHVSAGKNGDIVSQATGVIVEKNYKIKSTAMKTNSPAFLMDKDLPWDDLGGGVSRQIGGYDGNIMMVKFRFKKGGVGALHSHFHSQGAVVVSGVFELTINGVKKVLKAGDGYYVEPNVVHGAVCIEEGMLIDAFSPARQDFLK